MGRYVHDNSCNEVTEKSAREQLLRARQLTLRSMKNLYGALKETYLAKELGSYLTRTGISRILSLQRCKRFFTRRRTSWLVLLFTSSAFYLMCLDSYEIYKFQDNEAQKKVVASTQQDVTQAIKAFDEYLDLVEHRISGNFNDEAKVLEILRLDYNQYLTGPFPAILALTFMPESKNQSRVSRMGVLKSTDDAQHPLMELDGKLNQFSIARVMPGMGTIKSQISLEKLIPKSFVRANYASYDPDSKGFGVQINGAEAFYVLDKPRASVSQFINEYIGFVILLILSAIAFTIIGIALNYYFMRKQYLRLRYENSGLLRKQIGISKAYDELKITLDDQIHAIQQAKVESDKREELLLFTIGRFQKMASHGHDETSSATNMVRSDEEENNIFPGVGSKLVRANVLLRKIASGLPIAATEQLVDLKEVIDETLTAINSKIERQKATVKVENNLEDQVPLDKDIMRILLYNLLGLLFERYSGGINLSIKITYENGVLITFTDNGGPMPSFDNRKGRYSILELNRREITELAQSAAWTIQFLSTKSQNVVALFIPDPDITQDNVVSLIDRRKHAQLNH